MNALIKNTMMNPERSEIMDHQEEIIREQICDVCHKMWQLGWVAANDGNVSVRLDQDTIIATPTGISKSFIENLLSSKTLYNCRFLLLE